MTGLFQRMTAGLGTVKPSVVQRILLDVSKISSQFANALSVFAVDAPLVPVTGIAGTNPGALLRPQPTGLIEITSTFLGAPVPVVQTTIQPAKFGTAANNNFSGMFGGGTTETRPTMMGLC